MEKAAWGLVFGVILVSAVAGFALDDGQVHAQRPAGQPGDRGTAQGELIALTANIGQTGQQVTVIDVKSRVMSVYHIELATGAVSLKSVRNIHWDLQMDEFNGVSPLPREIRSLLEQR